jgi:hypothetical protein
MTRNAFTLEYVKPTDILELGSLFREIDPKTGTVPLFPDWVLVEVKEMADHSDRNGPRNFKVCKFVKFTPNFRVRQGKDVDGLDAFQSTIEVPLESLMTPRSRFRSVWSGGLQVNVLQNEQLLRCSSYPLPHIFRIYGRHLRDPSYISNTDLTV